MLIEGACILVGLAGGYLAASHNAKRLFSHALQEIPEAPRSLTDAPSPPRSVDAAAAGSKSLRSLANSITTQQSEIAEALRRAKVFSDNLVAAIVLRSTAGKITYCSPYTEVLTGYSIQEIKSSQEDFFETVMTVSKKSSCDDLIS